MSRSARLPADPSSLRGYKPLSLILDAAGLFVAWRITSLIAAAEAMGEKQRPVLWERRIVGMDLSRF